MRILLTCFFVLFSLNISATGEAQKTAKGLDSSKAKKQQKLAEDKGYFIYVPPVKNGKRPSPIILHDPHHHPDQHKKNEEDAVTLGFFSDLAVAATGAAVHAAGKGVKNAAQHHKADMAQGLAQGAFGALQALNKNEVKKNPLVRHFVKPGSTLSLLSQLAGKFG